MLKKILLFSGLVLTVGSCGGGTAGSQFQDVIVVDTGLDSDVPVGDIGVDYVQHDMVDGTCLEKPVFSFVEETGATRKPCKGEPICDEILNYNGDMMLRVQLTQCGSGIVQKQINWEIINDTLSLGTLDAKYTYTDQDGIAENRVHVGGKVGKFQVKICVQGMEEVSCLYYNIAVTPKGIEPLTVGFAQYTGMYLLDMGKVFLFKQDKTSKPKCSDLNIGNLPTATLSSPDILLTQPAVFSELPDLETDQVQNYTIVGLARQGTGPVQAYACNDTDGRVEWGGTRYVELQLIDLLPSLKGSYDITNTFDLVSGLPPNVANVVYAIIGFFQNPTAELMLLICKAGGQSLQDFCGYLFSDPQNPSIDQLTSTGDIVFQIVNAILIGILQQNCPYEQDPTLCTKIYWTGKDVSEILTKFQLLSTFTFSQEPDKDGYLPSSACSERWHTLRIRWTLGLDCPPNDDTCGWRNIPLGGSGLPDVITGTFEATVSVQKGQPAMEIKPHVLLLKYGALVNFAIEKLLLPQMFGDGSDGLPAVDSYEALIGSLLAGRECLVTNDCCSKFAEQVTQQTFGLTKNFVEGACQALIQTGAQYLRQQLTSLDTETGNFTIGTKEPCTLYDVNKDMKIDAFGKKDDQCLWDARLLVGGTTYSPNGTFYGKAK
jgi:hypothetical protein